jgi:hypothetical protein
LECEDWAVLDVRETDTTASTVPGFRAHAVALSEPPTPNRHVWAIEGAQVYVRRRLLDHDSVIAHLSELAELREAGSPDHLAAFIRYRRALAESPLLEVFSEVELDHQVSVIDRPQALRQVSTPMRGAFGRTKPRARTMKDETIDAAVEDLIQRIEGDVDRSVHESTRRSWRRRLRRLARS